MKKSFWICLLSLLCLGSIKVKSQPWSQKMAATVMTIWKDSLPQGKWTYDQGVILKGIEGVWLQTGDGKYFKYIQHSMDKFVQADGSIATYKADDYNIDNILCGRNLLTLYNVLNTEKYYKAVNILREQLRTHPRIPEGGFWHKKRYPNQMWLDGLYMGEPFYAEYATAFHEDAAFDDIANQFILMESHARDPKTGLLYHAWDQSKAEKWSDPKTGLSKNFWARADGWYAMALVDVLDQFPVNHPKRAALVAILNRLAAAVTKYQDAKSGVWYNVLDRATSPGNYLEASASCMFVYALAKGVRQGTLPATYTAVAQKGFKGIINKFIETMPDGQVNLNGTISVAGLGGSPYRDGSYEYYLKEKVVTNDPKGVGAFVLASVEVERLEHLNEAKGKVVLLDSYFNNEFRKDAITGKSVSFHYKWEEWDNNGFTTFGHIFNNYGFNTQTLYKAPDAANLKKASAYIIVDPDIPKENPDAKYIEAPHIKAISDWVKAGGVLVILNNDTGNAEFKHLNSLMAKFGIQFNLDSRNHVTGSQFEMGAVNVPENAIFKTAKKVYIKEISTFKVSRPAVAAMADKGDVIIATAKYGKGAVFAVGDPWFYNEYTDGRKLPPGFDNYKAANDLVKWVISQIPAKK